MPTGIGMVAAEGPDGAGGGDEAHRAGGAVDGGAAGFAKVGDGEDGDAPFGGESGERGQDSADDGVEVRVVGADIGVDRVDDDEPASGVRLRSAAS